MAKRKKSTTQKESLFNTGAAFPEIHKVTTDIDVHNTSSRNIINAPEVANTTTDNTENLSSRNLATTDIDAHNVSSRKINNPSEVTNATNQNEHLSSRNSLDNSDRWNPRYFGEEPPRSVDNDGQLNVFFDDSYEAPDPDDYKSIAEYETAWEQWEQDELRRQQLKTYVLTESKKSDQESYVPGVEQFLEETIQNDASVDSTQNESHVLVNSDIRFLEETTQSNTSVELLTTETKVLIDNETFLEEEKYKVSQLEVDVLLDTERFQNETYKAGRQRKGCLHKWIEEKTLKNGIKASYPRVIGARDPDNVKHWRWAYYWEEKVDGEWRNRSLYVPIGAVSLIIGMQNNYCSVDEIISFIKKSKCKGDKKGKDKTKKST